MGDQVFQGGAGMCEVPGSRRAYESWDGELAALRKIADAAREVVAAMPNEALLDRRLDDLDEALIDHDARVERHNRAVEQGGDDG